jgi:NAD(P)H dehydrogenase (quinone)
LALSFGKTCTALYGAKRLLLISASEVGRRFKLHKAVIDAAKKKGVELLVYTSLLRADSSEMLLACEHRQTEEYLQASGLPFVVLRNGWYLENHTSAVEKAIENGALIGSSNCGRFASASRADYAAAAVAVLTQPVSGSKIFELAGDQSFSMKELASEVSKQIGRYSLSESLWKRLCRRPARFRAATDDRRCRCRRRYEGDSGRFG